MPKVTVQTERVIFDDVFKIVEARVSYEKFNGKMSAIVRRLNFERGDSAAAVVYNTTAQKVILTNQFKYPTLRESSGWILEIVAGTIAPNETPEATIRREILEETGYQVSELRYITKFYVTPGGSSEQIHLFYAEVSEETKIAAGGGVAAEGEDIQLVYLATSELTKMLRENKISDAKTIIALSWLQESLKNQL
jgi:nudix-type nucleoside diphosphatase (YffH/AdpP family)